MRAQARKLKSEYADRAALFVGTLTPFELNFLAYPSIIMLYMDNRERHHELMKLSLEVHRLVIDVVAEAGWDGLHTAGPPIELIGDNLYDDIATSCLKTIGQYTSEAGIWFTFHNCGHIRGLLEKGTYNRVKLDMFETLAPPPMGELDDLRWARQKLDPCICTRGNLDLEFLKTGTPKAIEAKSRDILRETEGYRHIVSGADEILAGTPVENVRAMVEGAHSAW
jgi:uroporphyrinogen-III decarboxylase